jgi:uncharacterized protein (DUF1778 family)
MRKKVVRDDTEMFVYWDFNKPFVVSNEEFDRLQQLLEEPPEPTQALVDLMSQPRLPTST